MAQDREQSRHSLYREAEQLAETVDGGVAQAQIEELQRQPTERQAAVKALEKRREHADETWWEARTAWRGCTTRSTER